MFRCLYKNSNKIQGKIEKFCCEVSQVAVRYNFGMGASFRKELKQGQFETVTLYSCALGPTLPAGGVGGCRG